MKQIKQKDYVQDHHHLVHPPIERPAARSDRDDAKSWSTESEEREESENNSDKTVMFDENNGTLPPAQPSVDTSLSLQTSTASPTLQRQQLP
mmetsp:Transcript_4232/g.7813  ORF Transcript_4232/g.7813 Transcript_4232/m.7813 type:complete len:92 (+) Transcript_4232:507-782(+)